LSIANTILSIANEIFIIIVVFPTSLGTFITIERIRGQAGNNHKFRIAVYAPDSNPLATQFSACQFLFRIF
jgi:hypothetical protein